MQKKTGHLPIPMKKHYQIELYIYRSCLQINLILAMTSQSQQVATIETKDETRHESFFINIQILKYY